MMDRIYLETTSNGFKAPIICTSEEMMEVKS